MERVFLRNVNISIFVIESWCAIYNKVAGGGKCKCSLLICNSLSLGSHLFSETGNSWRSFFGSKYNSRHFLAILALCAPATREIRRHLGHFSFSAPCIFSLRKSPTSSNKSCKKHRFTQIFQFYFILGIVYREINIIINK